MSWSEQPPDMHGKVDPVDNYVRVCKFHERHGILYPCETYPPEVLAELDALNIKYVALVSDPAWADSQRAAGVPEAVIAITQIFAGVK